LIGADSQLSKRQQEKIWEQLDGKLLHLRKIAEKQCRQLKLGRLQWTPELANIRIVLKYWCLVKKICDGHSIDRKVFQRIAKQAELPQRVHVDINQVKQNIRQQQLQIKQYKSQHVKVRASWLEGLALALVQEQTNHTDDREVKKLKMLRVLQHREQQQNNARMIKQTVSTGTPYLPMDHVEYTDNAGNILVTYDKAQMEAQLIQENQQRFNQAKHSPFLVEPLSGYIGAKGELQGANEIIDG
jgi:hypothetical protein